MGRLAGRLVLLIGFVIAAALLGQAIGRAWYSEPPPWQACGGVSPGNEGFDDCVDDAADLVASFDYPQFKELATTFLTLLSATLVASIAFADKVVDLANAPPRSIWLLFVSWILLVLGLAGCVVGLGYMSSAAFTATGRLDGDFQAIEERATTWLFFAIGAYLMALVALMGAGAASIAHRRARLARSTATPSSTSLP